MKKALLVSNSEKSAAAFCEILKNEQYSRISVASDSADAKRLAKEEEFDLICINAPLAGENGIELTKFFSRTTRSCVFIFVPGKNADEVDSLLLEHGVLVIARPVNKQLFHHYLRFSECFKARILTVAEENEKLRHMVDDIKIINRAKLLLISCLNMSEPQAHRYLEKQSMNLRISMVQVAKQVIQTYEN